MSETAYYSVSRVIRKEDALIIVWDDGQQSLYPHLWLRDNAPENLHPLTGEKLNEGHDFQSPCSPWSVYVEYDETLVISWAGLREVKPVPPGNPAQFPGHHRKPGTGPVRGLAAAFQYRWNWLGKVTEGQPERG